LIEGSELSALNGCGVQSASSGGVTVRGCRIREIREGIAVSAIGRVGVTVENCEMSGSPMGCVRAEDGAAVRSRGNRYSDTPGATLVLASQFGLVDCEGDYFTGAGTAALAACADGKVDARGITIENVSTAGAIVYERGILALRDSTVSGAGKLGLQAYDQAKVEIENVTFSGGKLNGVALLRGSTGFFRRCVCTGNGTGAELTSVPGIEVSECDFSDNSIGGLLLGGASPPTIRDCTLTKNGKAGVDLITSLCKTTFENCNFEGNGISIKLSEGASATMIGGVLTKSGEIAVDVDACCFVAKGVQIVGSADAAVSAYGRANVLLEQCTIHTHDNYGIQAYDNAKVRLVQCLMSCTIDLFCLRKARVRCVLCKLQGAVQAHVNVQEGGVVSLRDWELMKCGRGVGMQISDDGLVKMRGTHVHSQTQFAAAVCEGGTLRARGAAIYDCGICGLYMRAGSEIDLDGCHVMRNGRMGIQALGGKLTLANCAVKEHGVFGILCKLGTVINESNTVFEGNPQTIVQQ
jgi:hypothetical protein